MPTNIYDKKIGLALGGGAARGLSHIGVLKVLEDNDIYPDVITGTSIGALVGALYAGGMGIRDIEQFAVGLDFKRLALLTDITLPVSGLISGKRVISLIKSILGDLTFSQLKYDFACVATDIITGEQVVLREGSLVEAVRASISLPGIFTPVRIANRHLVDGGLVNEVPVSVCREIGAEYVIGVNVIPEPSKMILTKKKHQKTNARKVVDQDNTVEKKPKVTIPEVPNQYIQSRINNIEKSLKSLLSYQTKLKENLMKSLDWMNLEKPKDARVKTPNIMEVLVQTLTIAEYWVAVENLKEADLVISPDVEEIGFWNFDKASQAITLGENAAIHAIQPIITSR
ncbi:MAG: patatin-like phospholipase family protein [Dehalococcoidales bacterium]|nr:MAG: patatin-like phospholipase family protein [Dehalococcoidales bacterium]